MDHVYPQHINIYKLQWFLRKFSTKMYVSLPQLHENLNITEYTYIVDILIRNQLKIPIKTYPQLPSNNISITQLQIHHVISIFMQYYLLNLKHTLNI